MGQVQSGNDKAGMRHYLEICVLLAEEGCPAGGSPGEQGRHRAGVRDLGWLRATRLPQGLEVGGKMRRRRRRHRGKPPGVIPLRPLSIPKGIIILLHFIQS